jgi:hypothetical protein
MEHAEIGSLSMLDILDAISVNSIHNFIQHQHDGQYSMLIESNVRLELSTNSI